MRDSKNYMFANNKANKKGTISIISSIVIFLLVGVISFASFGAGNYMATKGIFLVKTPSEQVKSTADQLNDRSKYAALFQVRDKLIEKFDGDVDDNKLLEGAIKGMTNSLDDEYTMFMNKNEFAALMKMSSGNITGIGVTITSKDSKLTIVDTIKDSPADRAGLIANDVIEKINDIELSGEESQKAVSIISEAKNSELKFTIKRADVDEFDVKITPEKVKIKSVEGSMMDSNIGYIRIKTFMNENTTGDFKNTIEDLRAQGMKGIILDLRENPGGLLTEAVGVASQFIPKDKIITYTVDKYDNRYDSLSIGGIAEGTPLVILVNGNSASASEVVTGALRDYKLATTIGETTFGKGIVQQSFKFSDDIGGLKITISKYYTPNGENIHKIGITPDVQIKTSLGIDEKEYDKNTDEQLKVAMEKIKEKVQ